MEWQNLLQLEVPSNVAGFDQAIKKLEAELKLRRKLPTTEITP